MTANQQRQVRSLINDTIIPALLEDFGVESESELEEVLQYFQQEVNQLTSGMLMNEG